MSISYFLTADQVTHGYAKKQIFGALEGSFTYFKVNLIEINTLLK